MSHHRHGIFISSDIFPSPYNHPIEQLLKAEKLHTIPVCQRLLYLNKTLNNLANHPTGTDIFEGSNDARFAQSLWNDLLGKYLNPLAKALLKNAKANINLQPLCEALSNALVQAKTIARTGYLFDRTRQIRNTLKDCLEQLKKADNEIQEAQKESQKANKEAQEAPNENKKAENEIKGAEEKVAPQAPTLRLAPTRYS